jgi:cytochrome c biogenesis protein CcmG, thiol:disulfide interchange protein DsbE
MRHVRALCAVALAAAAMAVAGCGHAPAPPSAPHAHLQGKLPDFARTDLSGARVDTAKLRGRVVVVKFFAKYCEPCKRTLPAIEAAHEAHADVAFVGIDEDESEADAREMASTYGLTFAIVHDTSNVLSGRFRVRELPATFIADREGIVRWVGGRMHNESDVRAAIEELAGKN